MLCFQKDSATVPAKRGSIQQFGNTSLRTIILMKSISFPQFVLLKIEKGQKTNHDFLLPRNFVKVCQRCWQPICRGITHPNYCTVQKCSHPNHCTVQKCLHPNHCTVQNAKENLKTIIGQVPRATEIIATDVIKSIFGAFEDG